MEYLITGIIVSLFAGIRIYLWWLRKNDRYWEKRGVPYRPRMGFSSFLKLIIYRPIHELYSESYEKYGRIYGEFELRKPLLTVCEPELLRDILVKDFHIFHSRREFRLGDPIIDNMVQVLKGEDWKRVRTIITPAFTSRRMRQMSRIINDSSLTVVENLGKYADQRKPVDCKEVFGAFSMDVIASAAFATKIDSHNDPDNIFVRHVKNSFFKQSAFRLIITLFVPNWITRRFRMGLYSSLDFFKDVILQVIKERKESKKKYDDILQLLMDAQEEHAKENSKAVVTSSAQEDETDHFGSVTNYGTSPQLKYNKLSEDELVSQCVLFFLVGYETTASTLTFMAYNLAVNPECQEKLIIEVDMAFDKHPVLDYDVIRDMKYLDCVVSETLRMHPVAFRGERTAGEEYKLGNTGIVIEKGMVVGFSIYAIHHDPEFFANPEVFDPDRFKPERISHPQYSYLPFGAGPRNCLGMRLALMEIKLCMCNILRHFRFQKSPTTKVPLEYKEVTLLLNAKEPFLMMERR